MSPVKERHENVEESKSSVERHENVEQLKLSNECNGKASVVEELFDEKEYDGQSALSKKKLVEKILKKFLKEWMLFFQSKNHLKIILLVLVLD